MADSSHPLPGGGPSPEAIDRLCFDPSEFREEDEDFSAAAFLVEKRRHVSLETLATDLATYRDFLQDQVIHIVNTDVYDTFLSVTNKLFQREADLQRLQAPLPDLSNRITAACSKLEASKQKVGEKITELNALEQKKRFLVQRLRLTVTEHRMRKLLAEYRALSQPAPASPASSPKSSRTPQPANGHGLNGVESPHSPSSPSHSAQTPHRLKLLKRIAAEAFELEADERLWAVQSEQQKAVKHVTCARLAELRGAFEDIVKGEYTQALRPFKYSADEIGEPVTPEREEELRGCLTAYCITDRTAEAVSIFRQLVCDPTVDEVITYRAATNARTSPSVVSKLFSKLCEILMAKWRRVIRIAHEVSPAFTMATAVWQAVADTVGKRMPYLFEQGNPLTFINRYTAAHSFVSAVEDCCPTLAALEGLRNSTEMILWKSRWNTDVYYKMREIMVEKQIKAWFPTCDGPIELLPASSYSSVQGGEDAFVYLPEGFSFAQPAAILSLLLWCVGPSVFLHVVGYRFLRLALHLSLGFKKWVGQCLASHNFPFLDASGDLQERSASPAPAAPRKDSTAASTLDLPKLLQLHCDLSHLRGLLRVKFVTAVEQHYSTMRDANVTEAIAKLVDACLASISAAAHEVSSALTSITANQSITRLQSEVMAIRAQFRMPKKQATRSSFWVSDILSPLSHFKEQLKKRPDPFPQEMVEGWTQEIVTMVTAKYRTLVKDMLTKANKQLATVNAIRAKKRGGAEADEESQIDKIMTQMYLDVVEYGEQLTYHGIDKSTFQPYLRLLESVQPGDRGRQSPIPDGGD